MHLEDDEMSPFITSITNERRRKIKNMHHLFNSINLVWYDQYLMVANNAYASNHRYIVYYILFSILLNKITLLKYNLKTLLHMFYCYTTFSI